MVPPTVTNLRTDLPKGILFNGETFPCPERTPKPGWGVAILILHFLLIKNAFLRCFTISEIVLHFFLCLVNVKGRVHVKSEDIKLVFKIYFVVQFMIMSQEFF